MSLLSVITSNVPVYSYGMTGNQNNYALTKTLVNFDEVFTHEKKLGSGASGSVNLYSKSCDGSLFAIKDIVITSETDLMELIREIELLQSIDRIPKLDGSCVKYHDWFFRSSLDGTTLSIVTEYIQGMSLDHFLYRNQEQQHRLQLADFKTFQREILTFAYWLFETLEILHEHNFSHRDIKPGNIMLDDLNHRFVLVDFGTACVSGDKNKRYSSKHKSSTTVDISCKNDFFGTTKFLPPEMISVIEGRLQSRRGYDLDYQAVDVWSSGITIYFVVKNDTPWESKFDSGAVEEIMNLKSPPKTGFVFIDQVLTKCLNINPETRPKAGHMKRIVATEIENLNRDYNSIQNDLSQRSRPIIGNRSRSNTTRLSRVIR